MSRHIGDTFGGVPIRVETEGWDAVVWVGGQSLTFEEANNLAGFINNQIFEVRSKRGDFDY